MSEIEDDTPGEWEPYNTLLCRNGGCGELPYLFMGIAPLILTSTAGGPLRVVNGGEPVQILMHTTWGAFTWSKGSYMKKNFHVYHPKHCKPGG